MFGYIRPYKADLRVREFTQYRAAYCGICKVISREYNQAARLATNYDLTFMALLLIALGDKQPELRMDTCILNPVKKHGIAYDHPALDYTAAVGVLLAFAKMEDNIRDRDKAFLNQAARAILRRSADRAAQAYPAAARIVTEGMREVSDLESMPEHEVGSPPLRFGRMLGDLMCAGVNEGTMDKAHMETLRLAGEDLGQWIYYMDALEDLPEDEKKGEYNALAELRNLELGAGDYRGYRETVGFSVDGAGFAEKRKRTAEADECSVCSDPGLDASYDAVEFEDVSDFDRKRMQGARALQVLENRIDQSLALLDYRCYGDIISNIVCQGLYETRMQVLRGSELHRL